MEETKRTSNCNIYFNKNGITLNIFTPERNSDSSNIVCKRLNSFLDIIKENESDDQLLIINKLLNLFDGFKSNKNDFNGDQLNLYAFIKKIVIMGKEPLKNLEFIRLIDNLNRIKFKKELYIETTLPNDKNTGEFINYLSKNKDITTIKGVNVYCSKETIERKDFLDPDNLKILSKLTDVHLNVIIKHERELETIINYSFNYLINVENNLKEVVYMSNQPSDLDSLHKYNPFMIFLSSSLDFVDIKMTNVSHNFYFKDNLKSNIVYHNFLPSTSVFFKKETSDENTDCFEINDIIVLPNGNIIFDWCNYSILENLFNKGLYVNTFFIELPPNFVLSIQKNFLDRLYTFEEDIDAVMTNISNSKNILKTDYKKRKI